MEHTGRGQEPVDSGVLSSEGTGAGADQKCRHTDGDRGLRRGLHDSGVM